MRRDYKGLYSATTVFLSSPSTNSSSGGGKEAQCIPLLLIGGFVVDLRSKYDTASGADEEVSGQVHVPIVAAQCLLADLRVKTHLH